MRIREFTRKTFNVRAVQVTETNMNEVAKWCKGTIQTEVEDGQTISYVYVNVHRPSNENQKKAYVGCWVLSSPTGYKVYTDKAFNNSFKPLPRSRKAPAEKRIFEDLEELRVTDEPVPEDAEIEEPKDEEAHKIEIHITEPPPSIREQFGFGRGPDMMQVRAAQGRGPNLMKEN